MLTTETSATTLPPRQFWPTWRGDVVGGLTAAVVLLAIDGAYGLMAFAALGPSALALAFAAGVIPAVVANLLTPVLGARGPLLAGSAAAQALLVHPVLVELLRDPRYLDASGAVRHGAVFAFVALGVSLAGLLQFLFGVLRAGRLVRYLPYPVHAGFMSGVAVLMLIAITGHVIGGTNLRPIVWHDAKPASVAIAFVALAIALWLPRWTRRVPSVLLALLAGTLLHHALALGLGAGHVGPVLGVLHLEPPGMALIEDAIALVGDGLLAGQVATLLWFSATVATMSTLQTLLAGSVVDTLTGRRRDGDREVLGQGAANMVGGALGAIGSAGGVSHSAVSLGAGARGTGSRFVYAFGLLAALALLTPVLQYLSMAALAGVFIHTAWGLIDPWTRSATVMLLRGLARGRLPGPALLQGYGVMLTVAATAVLFSIAQAVAIGVLIGMVFFIVRHARNPVRRVVRGDQRSSRRIRPQDQVALLQAQASSIVIIELDGPLFFGTADAAAREIERESASARQVIVDFARVGDIDLSGARVLLQAALSLRAAGRLLRLSSLPADGMLLRALREVDVHQRLASTEVFADADLALEAAEEHLLQALQPRSDAPPPLELRETLLGKGLTDGELQVLAGVLHEHQLARGVVVFRRGEPGDSMYVAVKGRIGIWLRAGDAGRAERRLVSFAPGVVFGEMAMLSGDPRSADGVVEEEAVVLELSRAAFDRLGREHPALVARLLLNLNLHLGARLRTVTDELQAANAQP